MQWAGHLIGALFFIVVALIPTGLYAAVWWFIPKTFWPILGTALGGVVWLVVQVVWALKVGLWWDKRGAYIVHLPSLAEHSDGDLDISF